MKAVRVYTMKAYGGSKYITPVFFNLGINNRFVFRFNFQPIYLRRKKVGINLIGCWVCPSDCLDLSGQKKIKNGTIRKTHIYHAITESKVTYVAETGCLKVKLHM